MPGITFTPVPQSSLDNDPDAVIGPLPQITFTPEEVDQDLRGPGSVGGMETDNTALMGAQDLFNGFNKTLTDALGVATQGSPGGQLASLYGWITGKEIADKPVNAREAIRSWANDAGITYNDAPVSELMEDIGAETFQQLLMSGAMLMGAGPMASVSGGGTLPSIVREMGKWMQANPLATVMSNLGGGAGAVVGQEAGGPLGEIAGSIVGSGAGAANILPAAGRLGGAAVGGVLGALGGAMSMSPIGAAVGGAAGAAAGRRAGGGLVDRVLRMGLKVPEQAMLGLRSAADATDYAREVVDVEGKRIKQELANVYANLQGPAGTADPQMAAEQLRRSVSAAYEKGQVRAGELWSHVDLSQRAPLTTTQSQIAAILKENPRTAPENLDRTMDLIQRVGALGKKPEAPAPGKAPLPKYGQDPQRTQRVSKPKAVPVTIKDLRGLQQVISTRMREENIGDVQRRYLTQLHQALDADIMAANPTDEALQTAREYTRWLHENLSRGPVGKFNQAEGTAYSQSLIGDLEAARALIQQSEAGSSLAQVAQRLDIPALEQEATQFVRQNFAEQFATKGPEATQKAMSSPTVTRFMQNFPKAAAELQADSAVLKAALDDEKLLATSAFKAYAEKDPQEAIRAVMSGGQKVQKAEQIKAGLMGNVDAMRGFKDGMLAELYLKSNGSPKKMHELMSVKDFRDMVATVLGPDDMKRLDRMVKAGMKLETQGTLMGMSNSMVSRAFRFLGAGLSKIGGAAPTIQQSGTTAAIGQSIGAVIMRDMPADTLFTKAITDPKWERVLYSRVPETMREMRAHGELVKGLIGSARALQTDPRQEK